MASDCYCTTINIGATWTRVITWKDEDGNPVNLSGYTGGMQVRSGGTVVVDLNTSNGMMVLGGADGTITLTISASDTLLIAPGKGVYDLFLMSGSGVVTKLLDGDIIFASRVTAFDVDPPVLP